MNQKSEKNQQVYSYLPSIGKTWKTYLFKEIFIIELIITLVLLFAAIISFMHFLNFIETRTGVQFSDPVLKLLKPIDLSAIIFGIIYLSIVIGLLSLLNDPPKLILAFQAYTVLLVVRILTLYLLPLNPPPGMLPLIDPIVNNIGMGRLLTKDLFFSGHTATIFLLFLIVNNKKLKIVFFSCFIILAVTLILQHAHYSIDVFSAPFFAYVSYRIVCSIKM